MTNGKGKNSGSRKVVKIIAALTLIISVGAASFFGYMAVTELMDRKKGTEYYDEIASEKSAFLTEADEDAIEEEIPATNETEEGENPDASVQASTQGTPTDTEVTTVQEPTISQESSGDATPVDSTESTAPSDAEPSAGSQPEETEPQPEKPEWEYHKRNPAGRMPSQMRFEKVREKYPNCVGWIEIDGIGVDHPIMQGTDNNYYLHHLPDGTGNSSGSLMMDKSNNPDFEDDVTIIHGHNMRNGTMFGTLSKYSDHDFYLEHPVFKLYTPSGDYDVEIFAALPIDSATYGYPIWFNTEEDFNDFVKKIRDASKYETDVPVEWGDRIVMLSTCAYIFKNARFAVYGKLV